MKKVEPEFSRPISVGRIPSGGCFEKLEANEAECQALARRLDLPALHQLRATLHVKPWRGGGLHVSGTAWADLTRTSVISLEEFRAEEKVAVNRYFLPEKDITESDNEDVDQLVAGVIDLGEVVAETVALELDPYPRKPGEHFESPGELRPEPAPMTQLAEKLKKTGASD